MTNSRVPIDWNAWGSQNQSQTDGQTVYKWRTSFESHHKQERTQSLGKGGWSWLAAGQVELVRLRMSVSLILGWIPPPLNMHSADPITRQAASDESHVTAREKEPTGKHRQPDIANFKIHKHGDKGKNNPVFVSLQSIRNPIFVRRVCQLCCWHIIKSICEHSSLLNQYIR